MQNIQNIKAYFWIKFFLAKLGYSFFRLGRGWVGSTSVRWVQNIARKFATHLAYRTDIGPTSRFQRWHYGIEMTMGLSHHLYFYLRIGNDKIIHRWPNVTYPTATVSQPANYLRNVGPTYPCYLGRGIRGEKSSKDMASSRNLVSTIGALAEVRPGDREESASPAWLAATAMNARDTTKD